MSEMNKKLYLERGERKRFNLILSEEIINGLIDKPVDNYRRDKKPQLKNFFLSSDYFAIFLKFNGEGKPEIGKVHFVQIEREEPVYFINQDGNRCLSRDRLVIRVYPRNDNQEPSGELRFSACPKNRRLRITPAPKFLHHISGKEREGAIWIASPGVNYEIR